MFQDWGSGEIVTRIDVGAKNVGLQFLFLLINLFLTPALVLSRFSGLVLVC